MAGNLNRDRGAAREHSSQHSRIDFARWHLDIDAVLNRIIPPPPWHLLPRPVSHFLGYRGNKPQKALGNLVIAFWSLIGVFCGVLLISEVSLRVPAFQNHHAPIIVGSFVCTQPYPGLCFRVRAAANVSRVPQPCSNSAQLSHPLRNLGTRFSVR